MILNTLLVKKTILWYIYIYIYIDIDIDIDIDHISQKMTKFLPIRVH